MNSVKTSSIAPSIRLIFAMFRLYADMKYSVHADTIYEGIGRPILDILGKQYPDQKESAKDEDGKITRPGWGDMDPRTIGSKLLAVARRENQGDEQRARDVIQDWLLYITGHPFDFTKGAATWEDALKNIYTNVRHRGMSKSMGYMREKKRTKSVDDAFGKRDEGAAPEGGEARMPTPGDSPLAKSLDDKVAIKNFIELIDDHVEDLRKTLSDETGSLFHLIFDLGEGSFGSGIDENMNLAEQFAELRPDLKKKHAKRWSGFIGDTRKKLLDEIWKYVDNNLSQGEYNELKEMFFSDVEPEYVRRLEKEKSRGKLDEQQGKDERKISRWKWMEEQGQFPADEKKSFETLKAKLKKSDVDVDGIPAMEKPVKEGWKLHTKKKTANTLNVIAITQRLSQVVIRPLWAS